MSRCATSRASSASATRSKNCSIRPAEATDMTLELAEIQGTVLRNRPMPYFGSYLVFRIDDARAAGEVLGRLIPHVTSAADWQSPAADAWINVVFTCEGLRRLGLDEDLLAGFPI